MSIHAVLHNVLNLDMAMRHHFDIAMSKPGSGRTSADRNESSSSLTYYPCGKALLQEVSLRSSAGLAL